MDRDDEHSAHTDRRYASTVTVIPGASLKVTLERIRCSRNQKSLQLLKMW